MQSCVYGVDLNPLAVELAKLSLWLTTVAKDRPLSFIDHHLRTGNSLVGARLEHLDIGSQGGKSKGRRKKASGQVSLFADSDFTQRVRNAVGNMWLIEGNEATSVKQVKEQERLYETLRKQLAARYIRLLNLVTATHFGLDMSGKNRSLLISYAASNKAATFPAFERILEQADQIAERERFFHWELEFPEIYFDRQGRPLGDEGGFEAVVGNPPYVEQERLLPYKPYFQQHSEIYHGVADLYLYFYEQGLRVAQKGGMLAYISSGTFARANFASAFRKWLPSVAHIENIIDFGENQPFEGAEMVRPSIAVIHKGTQDSGFRSLFIAGRIPASLEAAVLANGVDCVPSALEQPEWTFQTGEASSLLQKVLSAGRKLVDVVEGRMYRGVLTGLNEAFIIDQTTRDRLVEDDSSCSDIIKPMLRGEDLRPWYQEGEGRWLIFTRRGIDIDAYPSVKSHLAQFRDRLEPKPGNWPTGKEWPGRKAGSYKWYEIQDSVDYYQAFERPKIFWPDIAKLPRFSRDDAGAFVNNLGYILPCDDSFLLGVLQSRTMWYTISQICQPLRLRAGLWQYRMFTQFMGRLPIPEASSADRIAVCALADSATGRAQERYALHNRVRHRIETDLGTPDTKLNQKLTTWWNLDFPGLRAELKKALKTDIAVQERDEWEAWFSEQRAEHQRLTDEIIAMETDLNERVYALFDLTSDEIKLIEESTKYKYGEV